MNHVDWKNAPTLMWHVRAKALQAVHGRMLPGLHLYGDDDLAECNVCESTFYLQAQYDSGDPSVGWGAGWNMDIDLPRVSPQYAQPVLYACTGRRLLQEEEAFAVARCGGVAAVADCTALLSERDAEEALEWSQDAARENAAVAAWEDR